MDGDGESYEEILNPDTENENLIEVSSIVFDSFKENDDGSKS